MPVIQFKDVWEMYKIKFVIDGKVSWEDFWALRGVNFEVEKGETLGIIGENGAGKSTILKLIMGMLKPDRGEINASGRISGLLELGAGFQPEITGRENIYLSAGLFGLSQNQIEDKYEEIVSFADIGKFINAPVKCYSQGMFVRLAFAIAIHIDPDILLIDDTLAVGDEHFQRKCIKKIFELKEQGKTIIFVTHDMNMLSRLCKRALFLKDGKIVKDDAIDNIIPLYAQTSGAKEGVGILEKGLLHLVFNNGRLFLNWRNKLLTPNSGAYAVFLAGNKWYNSLQADWDIKKENDNKLIATGKFYQLALTQIWRLELADGYIIKWDIEMESDDPLEIQEGCVNIMLTDAYTRWLTSSEKGDFPDIGDKDRKWQALLEGNIFRRCIGVEGKEISDGRVPSLFFEQSDSFRTQAQISNTDYLSNCRVLQYKTLGIQNYTLTRANRFIYFSGKMSLDIPDIDNYLNSIQDEFILSNGRLRLTFNNDECILAWDGINLTKSSHMGTSIYTKGRWYSSNSAHWEIKKERENKLIARGKWRNLPIVQVWEIGMNNESSLEWKINMQVDEELDIEEQYAWFMCCKDYEYSFSEYGTEKFPELFLESQMDMLQKCIPDGVIGLKSKNNRFPTISLKFSKELNNFAKIFNSDFYNKARILRIDRVEPEQKVKFLPGEYPCFALEVILNKESFIEDSANTMQDSKLKFIFDKGKGRIFWYGMELTKKLGFYTSLRSNGRWHDSSSSAIWKIVENSKQAIKVFGKWLYLPIKQYWEITFKEDNIVEFCIKMEAEKEIEIDRLQTNIMLLERYREWITDKERGPFPLFKKDIGDDWDCIKCIREESEYIGVFENTVDKIDLPSILFSPRQSNSDYCLNIINSDIYHRGRVLQCLNNKQTKIIPGEYPYFRGSLIIKT